MAPIMRALPGAVATLLATIASFVTVYALCRWAGAQSAAPAIAAAVFSLSFGRRRATHGARQLLLAPLILAFVALAALGVGHLLLSVPIAGAAVFVVGMFLAVYSRNYDGWIRRLGTLVALPLITMLVVPAAPAHAPGGPLVDIALGASAGVISLAFATLAQTLMRRFGIAGAAAAVERAAAPARPGVMPVPTRMALQMAVALTAAFAVGFAAFPAHWGWCVLTAFIVCSGARGRGDAAYKGVLRLCGALGGTVLAAIAMHVWLPSGPAEAAAIFVLLFAALLLRDINYAYWAAGTTLILALLARTNDTFTLALLGTRLLSILAGAACAVLAAWFVFPIRSVDIVRRRLADALKAFDDVVVNAHDPAARSTHAQRYDDLMRELDDVAPPVQWHRRLFVRSAASEHPAYWIDLAREIHVSARAADHGSSAGATERGRLRRAIGASRKAIGQHHDLASPDRKPTGAALAELHALLATLPASNGTHE